MNKPMRFVLGMMLGFSLSFGQSSPFERMGFILGEWSGTGKGFGNETSTIESSFQLVMDGQYIEVKNDSRFEPTEKNPEGEHHIDHGFISFDKTRGKIVLRQFYIEGFVNQYFLNDSLSNDSTLIFETEAIENLPKGKARWTIKKVSEEECETIFDVSFTGGEYTCLGTNNLIKKRE